MDSRKIGAIGEVAAARFLREKGYDILAGNYRCRLGEIDLIAQNKEYITFVEVKTRSENSFYAPSDAVGYSKRQKIIATAKLFLASYPSQKQPRFDVVEVYMKHNKIDHVHLIANAFDATGK